MKKILLTGLMGVLLFLGLASMTANPPEPYPDCLSDCQLLTEVGLFPTWGTCMSACHACTPPGGGVNYAVCQCRLIDAYEGLDNLGLNFGECVTLIKGD